MPAMQILLSCAKTMADPGAAGPMPPMTEPRFHAEAAELAARLASFSADELGALLAVGRNIAAENRRRYTCFHDAAALPALFAYAGIVFARIAPEGWAADDLAYAQEHLNITSFLYGLLRPLDAVRPYRLEGGVRLFDDDRTLFEWWRERLTDCLIGRVRADDGVLVHLASAEMKRLFDWRRVCREVRVVAPEFHVREGGRLKNVTVYAKMCRGEMTRSILRGRISAPEALKEFAWEGFRYDAAGSNDGRWSFVAG